MILLEVEMHLLPSFRLHICSGRVHIDKRKATVGCLSVCLSVYLSHFHNVNVGMINLQCPQHRHRTFRTVGSLN